MVQTARAIEALESLQHKIEVDTDVSVSEIDLLERVTHNCSARVSAASDKATAAAAAIQNASVAAAQLVSAQIHLDNVEHHVSYLESITEELDQWISELEVKSRRLNQKSRG